MSNGGQVDADLVFAPAVQENSQEGEGLCLATEMAVHPVLGAGGGAVGADAIFDGDLALFVFAQGEFDEPCGLQDSPVDEGKVFFFDGAVFEKFAQEPGGGGVLGGQGDAAGFAI